MKRKLIVVVTAMILASASYAETPVERGEYLVRGIMGCGNCHTPLGPDGPLMDQEFAGRLVEDNEAFTAYAPNLTPAGTIANWSDAQLGKSIREGIRPDGSLVGPPMPFSAYRNLSDSDLNAVVAFLRTVPAVDNDVPVSSYRIPLPPAYGPALESVADVPRGVTVAYGEYLAKGVAHCMECHTPMGPTGPDYDNALGRGGFQFHGPWGISVASNLTNHADGLLTYSDDEIKRMITSGIAANGRHMLPPMPYGYLAQMTDDDLNAIVLYLRQLPGLPNG